MSMINKSNNNLHISDSSPSTSLVADKYFLAIKERLVSEGIYPDLDGIPVSLVNFMIESWTQIYEAGYTDAQLALHR